MYNMASSNICALLFCSSLLFLDGSAIEISNDGGFSFLIAIDEDIAEDEAIIQNIQVSVCVSFSMTVICMFIIIMSVL